MRTIEYENKSTSAKTNYRKISANDKEYLLDRLRNIQQIIAATAADPELAATHAKLAKKTKELNRTGSGAYNSIETAVEGILDNFTAGTQRDFSDRTAQLIDQITEQFNAAVGDVVLERIIWKQVDRLSKPAVKPPLRVEKTNPLFDFATVQDNF